MFPLFYTNEFSTNEVQITGLSTETIAPKKYGIERLEIRTSGTEMIGIPRTRANSTDIKLENPAQLSVEDVQVLEAYQTYWALANLRR